MYSGLLFMLLKYFYCWEISIEELFQTNRA